MSTTVEMNQRPHKRTGVWSSDTVKQKTSESILKRLLRSDVKRVNSNDDDDEISNQKDEKSTVVDVGEKSTETNLYRLPALKPWMNEVNMCLLLNQFNKPEAVKENDVLWNEDSLFADILNESSSERRNK